MHDPWDEGIGKTSLLLGTVSEYTPTQADTCVQFMTIDNKTFQYQVWDTDHNRNEKLAKLNIELHYPKAHIFLLCYSIDSIESYNNIKYKWLPLVKSYGKENIPFILIALKTDLRETLIENGCKSTLLMYDDCKTLSKEIKARGFMEVSVKDGSLSTTSAVYSKAFGVVLKDIETKHRKPCCCQCILM